MAIQKIVTFVDTDTGEILSTEYVGKDKIGKEPSFVKLYLEDGTFDGYKMSELKLMARLVTSARYDGIVKMGADVRQKVGDQLGYRDLVFRNKIYELCQAGLLSKNKCDINEYRINPFLFGKGKWEDIYEQQQAFSPGDQTGETG